MSNEGERQWARWELEVVTGCSGPPVLPRGAAQEATPMSQTVGSEVYVWARCQIVPGCSVANGVRVPRSLCTETQWLLFPRERASTAMIHSSCLRSDTDSLSALRPWTKSWYSGVNLAGMF